MTKKENKMQASKEAKELAKIYGEKALTWRDLESRYIRMNGRFNTGWKMKLNPCSTQNSLMVMMMVVKLPPQ